MSVESPLHERVARAGPEEQEALAEVDRQLAEMLSAGERARLVSPSGEEISLPPSAFEALQFVAHGMAQGRTIMLIPQGKDLTTQQVANLLHVSRPHVVKLLKAGRFPYHMVGTHRRVKIEDALAYKAERDAKRRAALDEIVDFEI